MKRLFRAGGALAAAAAIAAMGVTAAGAAQRASSPIKIGISLSLSGDFSDSGKAAMRGYQLWRDVVNKRGGILGRQVQLKIVDDTSSPTQVVTNYQNLITRDKVDLVFGPFSTLLNAPAARVAARYGYAFIEPAGGGPAVFDEKLKNVFFTQPAPVVNSADVFAHYILSLPKSQRPKTAAYPALDDPFASPIADRVRQLLEKAGVKTVFKTIYPSENADMTPIVQKMIAKHPDAIIGGTQNSDAFAMVKALVQLKYNPKFLFLSNGPNDPAEFPSKVGPKNVNGIFASGDWFPDAKNPGNAAFVKAYVAKYHQPAGTIDPTSAEAYAVGQVAEAGIKKVGAVDNAKLIAALHKGSWPTVEGVLRWNAIGEPQGSDLLVQWVNGKLLPVYPKSVALHAPVAKAAWAG
ncbi:MAG TPA: amino acid ABC transporter substrate-binding protein [Gaiellaceae bacterium]